LREKFKGVEKDDERNVVDLLIDQIEFANVILLNKTDLIKPAKLKELTALIQTLNPAAKIIHTKHSKVPLNEILNTKLFDFEKAQDAPGWLQSIQDNFYKTPETVEYGISSFVYRRRRPFHPQKLWDAVLENNELGDKVVRSKGLCWIASHHDQILTWNHAGRVHNFSIAGSWFACTPEEEWYLEHESEKELILKKFESKYGDRRQEIVFIGIKLNQAEVEKMLDSCLVTRAEFNRGPESWKELPNPFNFPEEEEGEEEGKGENAHHQHLHGELKKKGVTSNKKAPAKKKEAPRKPDLRRKVDRAGKVAKTRRVGKGPANIEKTFKKTAYEAKQQ